MIIKKRISFFFLIAGLLCSGTIFGMSPQKDYKKPVTQFLSPNKIKTSTPTLNQQKVKRRRCLQLKQSFIFDGKTNTLTLMPAISPKKTPNPTPLTNKTDNKHNQQTNSLSGTVNNKQKTPMITLSLKLSNSILLKEGQFSRIPAIVQCNNKEYLHTQYGLLPYSASARSHYTFTTQRNRHDNKQYTVVEIPSKKIENHKPQEGMTYDN